MPPPYVKTIREEILYEYAKLISMSAYGSLHRAFITDRFKNFSRDLAEGRGIRLISPLLFSEICGSTEQLDYYTSHSTQHFCVTR